MSASLPDNDGDGELNGTQYSGKPVSDEDVHAALAKERQRASRLERELEDARVGRTRAETAASHQTVARLGAEEAAVAQRLASTEENALTLRRSYAEALAEGRFDDAAEAQDKMVELRARQVQDKQYKTWLEGERSRAATPQPNAEVDLSAYSSAQRKWIKANPEFMTDAALRIKTHAAHQLAMAEGVEMDSPEYFEIVDEVVSRGRDRRLQRPSEVDADSPFSETGAADPPPRTEPARRERPIETTVSRSSPRQTEQRQASVRLSSFEMEAADITNPDIPVDGHRDQGGNWVPGRYERYAIQRAKLKARGQ